MSDTEFIIEPGRQDIIMTRVFNAPKDVVYKAIVDPLLIPNWWGPRELETIVDTLEARPGGKWRFLNRDTDGTEYAFHGVFHDAVEPDRVVWTFEFEGAPGHVNLETVTLEETDGKTKYTSVSVAGSVEERDAIVQSGMESGARETMDRLAELTEQRA